MNNNAVPPKKAVVKKYMLKKRQDRLRRNLQEAIIAKDADRIHAIAKSLGLKYTKEQLENTLIVK